MLQPAATLYFDLIDPGSYVMLRRAEVLLASDPFVLTIAPFEVRVPADAPLDPNHPGWTRYWHDTEPLLALEGLHPKAPSRVPWTRKALELWMHASAALGDAGQGGRASSGAGASGAASSSAARESTAVHGDIARALELARAYLEHDVDLARIDRLLDHAVAWGLDRTETKAVLDVDRYADELEQTRLQALEQGVRGVPVVVRGEQVLEGIHDIDALRNFVMAD